MGKDRNSGQAARELEASATGYGSGRSRILVTAERLFGQQGIDNVSLRQIATASGQANNSAVALHFGTKQGLIQAIIAARRPIIDEGRKLRLAAVHAREAEPSLRSLIECLMMPWADDVDHEGNHPYACFIVQLMWAERNFDYLEGASAQAPVWDELMQQIRARVAHLDVNEFMLRLKLMKQLFLTTALHKGHAGFDADVEPEGEVLFQKLIDLTVTVLTARP